MQTSESLFLLYCKLLDARLGKLAIVQPQVQVLGQAHGRPVIERIALEWQVLRQKLVANERDTLRAAALREVSLFSGHLAQGSPPLERLVDRFIEAAPVQLGKDTHRRVEVIIVPLKILATCISVT